MCVAIGAAALFSGIPNAANATQTVRELWDGMSTINPYGNVPLLGWGTNVDHSTLGLNTAANWVTSPTGNTSLRVDNWNPSGFNMDENWWLPLNGDGTGGCLAYYGSNGNMDSSLTNPATGNPYGDYFSQCDATHALTTNAYINFQANGTYYFSVRMCGSTISWYGWNGDNAGGIGFASGTDTNAHFVGIGKARLSPFTDESGNDIGSHDYITVGTLGQDGIEGTNGGSAHPSDSGGPYYPNAVGGASVSDLFGELVGQLVTTPSGVSTLSVKFYNGWQPHPDSNPTNVTWDATCNFTETNIMKQLLVWEYDTGPAIQDGIRVGTSWGDVVGLEIIGAPKASPASTVYAGTTVTLSTTYAGLNNTSFPMTYQWLSNSVALDPTATNATLVLSGTTTNFTADYSLVAANSYGMVTSAVTHVTVNPATPAFITAQPVSITRYQGSPTANFTVGVDGTPPYTYQWKHAGTNIQSAVTTSVQTNELVLPPIAPQDAGSYSCTITNQFGTTNSAAATITEIVPATNSYAAAVTALAPWGYWRLDDNGNADPTVYDYFGWNNGEYLDASNMTFGAAAAPFVGWSVPHNATYIGNQWWASSYRLNLPKLPIYTTNMTFTMWVNNNGSGLQLLADNSYGNEYGLQNNSGDLQFAWGSTNGTTTWDSGLNLPANTWTFVALVVEPTQVTIYMGTNQASLTSAVNTGLTVSDSTTLGDTANLTPLAVGRNPQPWAEGNPASQWASQYGTWSDVAVFYKALTPQQITNLFMSAGNYIPPTVAFSGTPTNVFVSQFVTFTDTSAVSTNSFWKFGDGNTLSTNNNVSVSYAYATAGTYTVSETATGPGGTASKTNTAYVVVLPNPRIGSANMSAGSFVLSGSGGSSGNQYRILTSTDVALPLSSWTTATTSAFAPDGSYSYTNSVATNLASFFILVSP